MFTSGVIVIAKNDQAHRHLQEQFEYRTMQKTYIALIWGIPAQREGEIDKAIKRGTGELPGTSYTDAIYEGYGPGGIAVMVKVTTDNKNRTTPELRRIFSSRGGNLGEAGCVGWMFKKKGLIAIAKKNVSDYDKLFEIALDNGAEDVKDEDEEACEITCLPDDFPSLKDAIDGLNITCEVAEITMIPENSTKVEGKQLESLNKMIDVLEDNDDVQNVYHNGDF